ncbi:MAG: hypothetical protein IV086_14735 [Hyphomonadaceae bacterium]|nr:MAG: hypothetical protein FD160_2915 [Caulobacteraceae bacterium]MBT9446954.1 hypothetical protein [Hyphomonadaceae bacterium]TPW02547.1 MAG: hypothetical protein FD124_3361 [Alphaproteobacteria bacterium]
MKRVLLLAGAAFAAVAVGALAHADDRQERREVRIERHMERIGRIDANTDGFVTRAEAQAEAERMFGELDGDNNGKLDAADRVGGPHVMIHRMGAGPDGGRQHGHGHGHGARRGADDDVDVTVRTTENGGQTVIERREVRIDRAAPKDGAAPMPFRPPHPPMAMMLFMHSDEADRNGDGALSKDEFVAQQLRYFDAADVNSDGKIKFEAPPMPPMPPAPPQPPRR